MSIHRAYLMLLAVLILIGFARPSAAQSSAPIYNAANGHWYQDFRSGGLTWQQARDAAAALSYAGLPGHLVTITSSEENQFILSQLPNTTGSGNEYWLGLYQDRSAPDYREPDGGWRWITGEPYSWNNWRGEPNNANGNEDVVVMRSTVGWNDLSYANLQYGYIVEYEPTPIGTGPLLSIQPNPVVGGQPAGGQVILAQPAGLGGVILTLISSNPAAAVAPASVTVPTGANTFSFPITTFPVGDPAATTISASYSGGTATASLQVLPSGGSNGSTPVYNPADGHWYQAVLVPGGITWPAARAAVAALSYAGYPGHLATITSAAETQFLVSHLPLSLDDHWRVGGFQDHTAPDYQEPAGGWRWITGEPRSYTNWRGGEPNNVGGEDFLEIHTDGTWNDTADQPPGGGYIVEFEPALPPVNGSASPPVYNPASGHWYQEFAVPGGITWPDARAAAAALSYAGARGHLVTITSAAENQFLTGSVLPASPESRLWIGAYQGRLSPTETLPPGGWRWVTGEPWFFTSWIPGQPDDGKGGGHEEVIELKRDYNDQWNDLSLTDRVGGYLVEYEPLPITPPVSSANLLVNGSFEEPDISAIADGGRPVGPGELPGWQIVQGPADLLNQQAWQPAPGEGNQTLHLASSQGAATIEQTFPTDPGRLYVLSGWLSRSPEIDAARLSIFLNGELLTALLHNSTLYGATTRADMRWQPFVTSFRAAGASTTLRFADTSGLGSTGAAWLDGLVVTPADEPSSGQVPAAPTAGDLLVTSHNTQSVLRYNGQTGAFVGAFIPSGNNGPGPSHGLLFGPDGNLYVGDIAAHAVRRYNGVTGAFLDLFVAPGSGGLNHPDGMVFGPDGHLYISSYFTDSVLRYDGRSGAFLGPFALRGSGGLQGPAALSFGPDGSLYVASEKTNSVLRYDGRTGAFIDAFVFSGSGGLDHPDGLLFGPDGQLYVSTYTRNEVLRYDGRTGAFLDIFVPAGSGGLDGPTKIRIGPDQNLYVVSQNNNRVLRYNGRTGAFIDTFVAPGSGGLNGPTDLAFVLGPPVGFPTPTGVGAIASLGWDAHDFGTVPLGTSSDPQTLTITNAGTGPLTLGSITVGGANPEEFAISRGADTIAPGETGSISIAFTPAALGSRSARLTITSNATNSVGEIRLTGTASQPVISSLNISPSSLGFGDQLVGTTNGSQAVLLQNTGQTPVEIRHVSTEGANPGDFGITADGGTGVQLLPGRICIVNVRFLPTAAGPRSASLTITDTAAGSPHLVPLSGTGLAAAVQLSSSSLTFGEQPVNSASGAQTVTITNSGTAPLTIPAVTLAGDNPGEFTIGTSVSGVTLAPGESRALDVRFAPTRPGSRGAILVISDNAPGSPHLVTLSGTGTAPSVTFGISRLERPTKVSFGEQPVGSSSAAQSLIVTNGGAAPLTISSVRITGANAADFALSADSGGAILAPGASRNFTLRFKPASKGSRSASLTLSDNAAGSPHSVALQGVGVLLPPKAPSGLAVKVASFKEIQLTWTASSADATAYAIWRKTGNGEFQRYGGVAGNLTRFVDQHVSPKTTYTYRVRANGPGGVSGWSSEAAGTPPAAPPVAPSGLTVRPLSASQMELRWTDNSSDETSFALWRKSGAGQWARVGGVPTGTSRYVDRNLASTTSYSYQVRANGPGGVSAWSAPASGMTLSGPK